MGEGVRPSAELEAQGFKRDGSVEYERKSRGNVGDVKENIASLDAWGEKNP